MDAIRVTEFVSSVSSLRPQATPFPPQPRPGEVLVAIHCAALNHVDLLYAQGKHQNNKSLIRPPFTLGLEFSGTVFAVGSTDTTHEPQFKPGDKVFGAGLGAYAEWIVVPARSLHHIPHNWTFEDAAGLAATANVAYGAVAIRGGVKEGDWVMVQGAAGGIGVYACQIAKALGAKVIAGVRDTRNSEKVGILRTVGCVDGIVATGSGPGWEKEAKDITCGHGIDVVIDSVGLVKESIRCLRPVGGKIVLVGFAGRGGVMEQLTANRILLKQAVIIGYRYGDTDRKNPKESEQVWRGLMEMVGSGALKPVVYQKTYHGLDKVKVAMEDLQARKIYGKAIIYVKKQDKPSL
ncbi:quinone oxidoreductase, putative [Coccidioides posadasii C735 delta SOWgp]|uniref:Quinone oxidoreductase, putative n=1 Tax=Coccidioides posadasii (strain C735) TaxID=222929 RepID=C5PDR7_COCP7|nr:quinone oxidoreductase, putative [Coccidioides posadasii C735 delta SOWgp]EER25228.1 quinone oxidoreductase, putative [Coccidioides posadasii C735 delta SOWgp]|eukprot:XP_003067373.1 quinone oxidoreductase, putative [Coccidioides posadasii C735 delta SOWgp]